MRKTMKKLTQGATRLAALALALLAAGGAWAGKLGEGITAYYDCETHTDSGTTVTVTGKSWDGSALTDPGTLELQWAASAIGNPSTTKFGLCFSGGGKTGRCYLSSKCNGLLPGTSVGDWSFSFWLCGDKDNPFVNTPDSGDNQGFRITKSENNIVVSVSETTDGSAFNKVSITSSSTYTFNSSNWHNVIVVRSGNTLTLYVDGVSAGTASMTANSYLVNNSNKLTMGASNANDGIGQGNGSDEYCVWNRALTQGEVLVIAGGVAPISAIANSEFPAAVSLEEFGGFVTTLPQLAFKNATLSEITADTLKGRFSGGSISAKGKAATFFNFASPDSSTLTCEAQMDGDYDGNNEIFKSVFLTFTQNGDDVYVSANSVTKYMNKGSNQLGTSLANQGNNGSLATSISASGYGIYNLRLPRTYESDATVVWNAGELLMPKIGSDGNKYVVTLPASGMSVDANGNLKVASSGATTGATIDIPDTHIASVLIKYSSLSTVADSIVSLATAQATYNANGNLVVVGPRTTGNGALTMTGYWDNTSANNYDFNPVPTLTDGSGYFMYSYHNDTCGNGGTYAYAGTSPSTLSGSGNTTLRWTNDSYWIKKLSIGGPITTNSGVVAWPNVAIEKVSLFIGSEDFYKNSQVAGFSFSTEATITADGTYTLSGDNPLFVSVCADESYIINVRESATLDIPAATTVNMITFNVAEGKTLTLTGSTLTATGGIKIVGKGKVATAVAAQLYGTLKGDGRIVYSAKPTGMTFSDSAWTGTVELNSMTLTALQFSDYGNSRSTVCANGLTCYPKLDDSDHGAVGIIEVGAGGLTFNEKYHSQRSVFSAALTGSGAIHVNTTQGDGEKLNQFIFTGDVSGFSGSIDFNTSPAWKSPQVVFTDLLAHAPAQPTTGKNNNNVDYAKIFVTATARNATVGPSATWTAANGVVVDGTLTFSGAGCVSGPVITANGSTLDFSGATSNARISGTLTLASGTTIKLPAGATLPYQLATAGDGGLIDNVMVQIGEGTPVTGTVALSSGTITALAPVDIDTDKTYTVSDVFGTPSAASSYEINVTSGATVTVPDTAVGTILYNFTANGNTITLSGGYKIPAAAQYLKITDASTLTAGNYTLFQWTTPQQFTTSCAGYGRFASVDTTGLDSSLTAEVIYGAKAIYLRVYNTEAQAARKPLVIWPYGDSITEGYNAQHTGPNYRILLYQKLRMLGYNVKSTGVYGLDDGYNAVDPSGTPLSDNDKWHSAKASSVVSAGLSGAAASKGALVENVDTMCVQAGTPDAVLLHIGVNDLNGFTEDVESVFNAWCDVVNRLVRNLPTSKIVVSTALHGREPNKATTNARVDRYNAMIKAKMDDMPTEWSGHVVLADLCSIVQSQDTGILYSDHVHPDWWGHDQMADGWLEKIVELYDDPDATDFPSQAALPAIPGSSELGAANKSELADYRAGFTKYGDISIERGKDIGNIVYGNVDENAVASNIGRVGYFVEYVRTDNHAHKWVWVDMDAFGDRDIAAVGLPSANHQQVVNHLHVYSNHGAVDNVAADDDTVSGFIEFTPYNISQAASSVEGAPADSCPTSNQMDWNDTVASSGQFAAMQVFRIAPPSGRPAQTIFAFNNWRGFTESAYTPAAEFGIGNFSQHIWSGSIQTLDYIYTYRSEKMNADAYTVKNIEIWTKPVYTATMSATGNFSGLEFSPTLPGDMSACDLIVNVTDDATLTFDAAKSVGAITFNIAANKTLTLDGTSNLTVGKVVVSGPGKIAFTASPEFGALRIASDATIALASGQAITLDGALTVESGVTLTMEPDTMAALSSDMISAGSVVNNGTVALTAPDEGSDYSISITGTAVMLRRVTKNAFTYNPVPGENTPSGWITSWGGEPLATTSLRVGPSSAVPYVYHVASGKHPWVNLAARTSGFSYAIYADVSQMESDKGIITAFGNTGKGLFLYRDGNYVKLAHVVGTITTPAWVPGVAISAGYHLYTVTFDPTTGAAALYLDDGSICAVTDGSTHAHLGTQGLNAGFQLGSVYQGVGDSGFHIGAGLAVCAVRGYDVVLQPVEVETLSESFPATDGNVTWNVMPDNSDNTVIVTSTTFGDSNYLGQSKGTLTIPEGSTVNVKHIRVLNNNNTGDRAIVNIAGTLNITSESTNPNVWADGTSKGVLFGHYHGQATYNITGSLLAENTYIEVAYTAEDQLLDIDGGTVKTKALYAQYANGTHTVKLRNGGTLEVSEILSSGVSITKEFKYGTFRVTADATETRAINFSAAGGYATTLDPFGNTLTLQSAALTGPGDITVNDSSDGHAGKVVFVGGSGYTGRLIMTDDNASNIDISGYTGTVLCQGTAATTIAKFDGFTGKVYFTGNVDATGVDLSGATVNIADNCTFTADAGKEGALVLGSGVAVTLHVDDNTVKYEGYVPAISGNGTVGYYNTTTSETVSGADHVNGNNLLPYYNVWSASATASENTLYANQTARWKSDDGTSGALPADNKNVAFKLENGNTVTLLVDATKTFNDIQVFGNGTLIIQKSGDSDVLTVGKGLYTTANTTVQIDSGLAFGSGAMLEIDSAVASGKYVGVNCGTAESPFEIPFIDGSGLLIIAEGKGLTTGSMTIGTLTVQGALALTGTGSATTASVSAGGVIDVTSGTSLAASTLTVNGVVNMGSKTLSATTISGTGRVEYTNNKLPDASSWATGTASTGWRGTVAFCQTDDLIGPNLNSYGNANSTVALTGVSGSNTYLPNDDIATNVRIEGPVTINNGNPLDIASGWTQDRVVKIASFEVDGALTFVKTGQTSWNNPYKGIYYAELLKCGANGSIDIGNQFGLRVDAVDFAEAPSASSCLVPISLTRGGDNKADGVLYGPNGVAGEVIPVTVNGVANGQKLVHATVNETTGLYLAVASVTVNETTSYYPTLAAAKAAVGNDPATITLLENTSENVALAVGQSLVTGGHDVGMVSTSAEHYHVVNNAGVYTVAIDQFAVTIPSVANTTVSVSYTSGGEALVATTAGDITVDAGTDVTATWTAASGYKITSGASQTLNAVTSAQTLAAPTVEAKGATVSDVSVSYGADYASATVTATVSDTALDYYISWANGEPVKGSVSGSGSQVTFDVSGINHTTEYQSAAYSITAKDGETTVTTTGGSGESVAADVDANWINENATTHGNAVAAGGVWTNAEAVTYSEGKAAITDNRFEATSMSTSSRVVLEFNVCFTATNDANVDGDAQGAIKLGEENSATTFMVLAQGGGWTAVSNDALTPDPAATYKVVMTFDYANNTYAASVNDYVLTNASGFASFPLAATRTGVKNIDFAGSGTLTSMKGDQVEGYMVKDNVGHWYATIQEATQAYNSANGPYTVLHSGTAPSGWKIDETTKALIKLAKGFFFMAY